MCDRSIYIAWQSILGIIQLEKHLEVRKNVKHGAILLLFCIVGLSVIAEENWSDSSGETATVTIINPTNNYYSPDIEIVYNQEVVGVLSRGEFVEVLVPEGDNTFFLLNSIVRDDAFLIEAEAGENYYLRLKKSRKIIILEPMDSADAQEIIDEYSPVE